MTGMRRVPPLRLEWHGEPNASGDFVWPGWGEDVAVAPRILDVLRPFRGFEAGPVEVVNGPALDLIELWVLAEVPIDRERSAARCDRRCGTCGAEFWERTSDSDGLRVRSQDAAGRDIFRLREFPTWILVTDAVKDALERARATNVAFEEMGEMFGAVGGPAV